MQSAAIADPLGCRAPRLYTLSKRRASAKESACLRLPHAVATPVETLEDVERQKLAKQTGYRSIGKEIPKGVTLSQIVQSLPKEVFEIDDWKAWRAVAITVGAVTASIALIAVSPWYLLPLTYIFAGVRSPSGSTGWF